jgi:hypothetical protein
MQPTRAISEFTGYPPNEASIATKLPVAISGCVPELNILIGLLEFLGYYIEARQLGWTKGR